MPHLHGLHHFDRASHAARAVALLVALAIVFFGAAALLRRFEGFCPTHWEPGVPAGTIAADGVFTLLRLAVAYGLSVLVAVPLAVALTQWRWAETWLLPVFDVLQSVPVLAFFPVAVAAFATWGFLEGAATLVLMTAMLWSVLFSLIGGMRAIPHDVRDAARLFGARGVRYVRAVVLPACVPSLVTGSILAWGAGWNVVIVAEYIQYSGRTFRLPGLGSLLDQAVYATPENHPLFLLTLALMVLVIVGLNRLVWRPLLRRAEHYTFE